MYHFAKSLFLSVIALFPIIFTLSKIKKDSTLLRGVAHIVHGAGAVLVDELIHQIQADPVEHDGGNDLVDVEVGLEETGDRAPQAAQHGCCQQTDEPRHQQYQGQEAQQ